MNQTIRLNRTAKSLVATVALACAIMTTSTAMADPVLWQLTASSPSYGTSMSGSFVYDRNTNSFSDVNISSTESGGAHYTILSPVWASNSGTFFFFDTIGPDLTGAKFIRIDLASLGGVLTFDGGTYYLFPIDTYSCTNADCSSQAINVSIDPLLSNGDFTELDGRLIDLDVDHDGVANANDLCPGTVIPEAAPTSGRLGHGRHALTIAGSTDFTGGDAANASYSTADTAGCSCEQIVDVLSLGKGQLKFGCSNSVMESWVGGLTLDPNNP